LKKLHIYWNSIVRQRFSSYLDVTKFFGESMKKFLITLLIVLPTVSMATQPTTIDELCFKSIQKELTDSEVVNELITLQDISVDEKNADLYHAYAWIEDRTYTKIWPYHSYWDVVVVKSADKCAVQSLVFVEGNM
jgi:hypothetical protein